MEAPASRSTAHPAIVIAAVAVTLLCAAGIAAIMGWLPSSNSQPATAVLGEAAKSVDTPKPAEAVKAVEAPRTAPAPVAAARPKHVAKTEVHADARRDADVSKVVEYAPPVRPVPTPVKQICYDCGVVDSVRTIEKAGEGSGLGAVAGGVAGAVLGHQVGGGRGKDVMTVLGAVGGGFAGNQIEKTVKKTKTYDITVRFEDGTTRVFNQATEPAWRAGDKVRVNNGVLGADN